MHLISQIISLLTSVIIAVLPVFNFAPKSDDILLNVGLISDTHLDTRLPLGKLFLKLAFKDMNSCKEPLDAVVVSGDLTNYGDVQSVVDFFDILTENSNAENSIIAMGNHEIGHTSDFGFTNQQARETFLELHNEYLGTDFEKNYYSFDVKGYKFIVLCDESEDNWDVFEIYSEQVAFLDKELEEASETGLPTFVVCHEPVEGVNGQPIVWEGGAMDTESSNAVKAVLEKYENVFYISGHMHSGLNGKIAKTFFDFNCVETINGVTYISLPTYLLVNRYGIPWNGTGMQMEVYEDEIVFRGRNFLSSYWYPFCEFTVELS